MELTKLRNVVVADVLPHAGLEPGSAEAVRTDRTIDEAVRRLAGTNALTDALKLLAHGLPKREAVWWACTCCRACAPALQGDDLKAVDAAEKWVYEPTDANARSAYEYAERLGFKTPAGWAAVSAMWSSNSLAPTGQVVVPPAHYLTGVAVAGAVMLAAAAEPVAEIAVRQSRFLRYGLEIAAGGDARRSDGAPR